MMPLFAVLFLFAFIMAFGALLICAPTLLERLFIALKLKSVQPVPPNPVKLEAYECGVPEQTTGNTKIHIKFYLTAILFILFDIEIIFMYPWAITFKDFMAAGEAWYILGAMGFFLLIFIFGLFWEIKSRALEWE